MRCAMSLSFFPLILPDEDLRSIIFRYHIHSGNKDFSITNNELFERRSTTNPLFPYNLNRFYSLLSYKEYDFLRHNTLFPFIKPFIPKDRLEYILNEIMCKGKKGAVGGSLVNNYIFSNVPRYCPSCLVDNEHRYGTVFLHRYHQFSFLNVCPDHNVKLLSYCKECHEPLGNFDCSKLLTTDRCSKGHRLTSESRGLLDLNREKILFDEVMSLVNQSFEPTRETILLKLKIFLAEKGYTTYSGKFDRSTLIKDFKYYLIHTGYNEYLPLSAVNQSNKGHFLFNSSIHNVLLYILLMKFLSGSVKNFIEDKSSYVLPIPFGTGPWQCNNKICPNFNLKVISYCRRVDKNGKFFSGYFCCPHCGFTYEKQWKWKKNEVENKRYKIIAVGHLWVSKYFDYKSLGFTDSQIAKKLLSYPAMVQRLLNRTQEMQSYNEKIKDSESYGSNQSAAKIEASTEKDRKRLEKILSDHKDQGLTRNQIRELNVELYRKLMRIDREWMENSLPPSRKSIPRINSFEQDKYYSELIRTTASEIYLDPPIGPIKKFTILSKLPGIITYNLYNKPDSFPNTIAVLNDNIETNEAYLVRHFPLVIQSMINTGYKKITFEKVKTFRSTYRNCSPELNSYFLQYLCEMGF
jgi:hypothetical protein